MFDYKDAQFYTDYFSSQEGFSVLEEFKESEDKIEKNLYIGSVEVLNTIHPLILRVEIPFTFPHNKLVFRTKSLSGYPHLIHNGKIENGDWFCLNTPFAETPEEQLNLEITRLKEWISHQMREDLPPVIKDSSVKRALAFANAYEWENLDEVKEFSSQAMLTFVGNFHNNLDYFNENLGYIHCIKTPDNRFYAVENEAICNYKLPYIIVDQTPESSETLSDFVRLMEQYEWDDKICKHLLPELNISNGWQRSSVQPIGSKKDFTEPDALKQIERLISELQQESSYLPQVEGIRIGNNQSSKEVKKIKVLPSQKHVLLEEISSIKESVIKNHGYNPYQELNIPDVTNMIDEEFEEQIYLENMAFNTIPYEWHHFAFGIKHNDGIAWYILFTNIASGKFENVTFDLTLKEFKIQKITSSPLHRLGTQVITKEMYFGRGAFSQLLSSKKIAIVGLGAIGSMVASSLAHCGASKIGLWDFDIVEPGNICRSSYTLNNMGESKERALASVIKSINPFIKNLRTHGYWLEQNANHKEFIGASFYANVNYNSQEEAIKELDGYDLIMDCTGSNEMLHFLSYAASNREIISMCITNHANNLLCISNKDGNPFEQRKTYLSRMEQDTKNFYIEGEGCYSPTFLANNCDIASLVNLALRDLNLNMDKGTLMHSTIYSYSDRGIVADRISTYQLDGYDILLNVSTETLYDAEEMNDSPDGAIGYIFGSYSKDGKQVMITHIVDAWNAKELLTDAFKTSKGIIDYIGDYRYSGEEPETYSASSFDLMASKAGDDSINTNNPLLAVRNPDGSLSFFLYINNELVKFSQKL